VVGKILKHHLDRGGYPRVALCRDGKQRWELVHTLVATAFLGPRDIGKEVNHINCNKTDARAENLEYVTPKENGTHAALHGLLPVGEAHRGAKLTNESVQMIRIKHRNGATYEAIARDLGVGRSAVARADRGITWKHVP
jgi:hypothetical protein